MPRQVIAARVVGLLMITTVSLISCGEASPSTETLRHRLARVVPDVDARPTGLRVVRDDGGNICRDSVPPGRQWSYRPVRVNSPSYDEAVAFYRTRLIARGWQVQKDNRHPQSDSSQPSYWMIRHYDGWTATFSIWDLGDEYLANVEFGAVEEGC